MNTRTSEEWLATHPQQFHIDLDENKKPIRTIICIASIIPVDNISVLWHPTLKEDPILGIPLKMQGISIGTGEDIETFKIVRRNPPSKRNPKGSITVRRLNEAGEPVGTYRIEERSG